jgi:nucleoside-diphosphate-sugar epimerase
LRVFLAGGTGAVGRQLTPRLVAAGHTVMAISRRAERAERLRAAGAQAVVCDVFDGPRLIDVVRRASPDVIIHQLTDLPGSMNPRQLEAIYARNNRVRREGTANLITAAREAGVRRMIVQSMATWYRPEGGAIKTESDPLWTDAPEPLGAAVRTVHEMEQAVLDRIPVAVVLRYGAFYGAGTWYARDGEMAERVRKRGLPIVGDGAGITSFVLIEDAASAVLPALEAAASGVFNIVDDEPAAASEWLPVYARALGAPPPRRVPVFLARLVLGKALTAWVTTMRGASNRAASATLGWRPDHPTWRKEMAGVTSSA